MNCLYVLFSLLIVQMAGATPDVDKGIFTTSKDVQHKDAYQAHNLLQFLIVQCNSTDPIQTDQTSFNQKVQNLIIVLRHLNTLSSSLNICAQLLHVLNISFKEDSASKLLKKVDINKHLVSDIVEKRCHIIMKSYCENLPHPPQIERRLQTYLCAIFINCTANENEAIEGVAETLYWKNQLSSCLEKHFKFCLDRRKNIQLLLVCDCECLKILFLHDKKGIVNENSLAIRNSRVKRRVLNNEKKNISVHAYEQEVSNYKSHLLKTTHINEQTFSGVTISNTQNKDLGQDNSERKLLTKQQHYGTGGSNGHDLRQHKKHRRDAKRRQPKKHKPQPKAEDESDPIESSTSTTAKTTTPEIHGVSTPHVLTDYEEFFMGENFKRRLKLESVYAYLCMVFIVCLIVFGLWCLRGLHNRNAKKKPISFHDNSHMLTVKEVVFRKARYLPMFYRDDGLEEVFVHDCGNDP